MVLFAQQMTSGVNSFVLLAIPLFIFGELMNVTGVTRRIVGFAATLVGHINGGLANVGVTANFIMSGCSGSALADAAATGTVLLPEMKKRGFKPAFSSAVIASAATVGPIVPLSISFVLLGAIVNVSVGQLFGGVVLHFNVCGHVCSYMVDIKNETTPSKKQRKKRLFRLRREYLP